MSASAAASEVDHYFATGKMQSPIEAERSSHEEDATWQSMGKLRLIKRKLGKERETATVEYFTKLQAGRPHQESLRPL